MAIQLSILNVFYSTSYQNTSLLQKSLQNPNLYLYWMSRIYIFPNTGISFWFFYLCYIRPFLLRNSGTHIWRSQQQLYS